MGPSRSCLQIEIEFKGGWSSAAEAGRFVGGLLPYIISLGTAARAEICSTRCDAGSASPKVGQKLEVGQKLARNSLTRSASEMRPVGWRESGRRDRSQSSEKDRVQDASQDCGCTGRPVGR
jgi:hypothetical protein